MVAPELFAALKPSQESRGYFFNRDMDQTMALLEALLKTGSGTDT